jgi:site-specific DNA-adenine methylase
MPVPYMGSKRKSAQKIYQTIKNFNPKANAIVDLFCGGFAISEIFIANGWNVISNDKNKYVVALINQTSRGLDEAKCLEWVSREKFFDIANNPEKYEDWYVGYVQCCWTFGNDQRSYIFGKETEPTKLAGHEIVVNKNPELLLKIFPKFPKKYIDGIIKQTDWHKRRMALKKVSKAMQNRSLELEQLQQLERLERLEVTDLSYNEVIIPKDAIIYCDPPYEGTSEYKEGGFNHKEFWEWARQISKTNKVYVSEYNAPSDFKPLLSFTQKSTFQGGTQRHNDQPMERLFVPINQEKFKI